MTAVVLRGDAAHLPLPDGCADLLVCSPPYFGLRSYTDEVFCADCIRMRREGRDLRQAWPDYEAHREQVHRRHYDGQIGSEATPGEYLEALWACTAEWVRVLKPGGSVFVNLGDKYAQDTERSRNGLGSRQTTQPGGLQGGGYLSSKTVELSRRDNGVSRKSLLGLPWRYAIGCMDRLGLILRAEIVWAKPNGLPESVTDRVRRSHEQVFHFTRLPRYFSAVDEIREPHSENTSWKARGRYETEIRDGVSTNGFHASGLRTSQNPLGKLPGSVWEIPSAPLVVPERLGVDHFAAFPPGLVRRVVLGWSPSGVCVACGEGRHPVSEAEAVDARQWALSQRSGRAWHGDGADPRRALGVAAADRSRRIVAYACACPEPDAPARPALVVDPFGGTGTTALVASVLGRTGVTVDRSGDYCRLAAWRVRDPGERARALGVPKPPPVPDGQGSLFDSIEAV